MSTRRNIIVRADLVDAANAAAGATNLPGEGDTNQRTWVVPLESFDAPGLVAAYVCSWDFDATGHDLGFLLGRLAAAFDGVAPVTEVGTFLELPPDLASAGAVVYDPAVVEHQAVLDQLGLRPPIVDD
jgi:hypothetical protein